jgi:hypothetical protein
MQILDWMRRTFADWGDRTVKVICMPLPPSPVRSLIYMPDCFTSKTFDNVFDRDRQFRAVSMEATERGPAILAVVKLKDLISFDKDHGFLTIENATCCATISYYVICEENGLTYANEVSLDSLAMPTGSCHPGSHYVIPDAPYLTAILQYAQAPEREYQGRRGGWHHNKQLEIVYAAPDEGKAIFPQHDYHCNRIVDSYVARCAVHKDVSFARIDGAIGKWAWPFLKGLRRNIVNIKEASYERWTEQAYEIPRHAGQENDGSHGRRPARTLVNEVKKHRDTVGIGGRAPKKPQKKEVAAASSRSSGRQRYSTSYGR